MLLLDPLGSMESGYLHLISLLVQGGINDILNNVRPKDSGYVYMN